MVSPLSRKRFYWDKMAYKKQRGETHDRSSSSPDQGPGQVHDLPAPGPQGPGLFVGVCWRQGGAGRLVICSMDGR